MVAGNGVWGQFVDCPEGCEDYTCRRNNMGTHLIGGKHNYEREAAWETARMLPVSTRREPEQYVSPAQRAQRAIEREHAINGTLPPVAAPDGAASPPVSYEKRMMELVDCPKGCGAVSRRKRMYRHLESIHHVEHRAALRTGASLPTSTATESARGTQRGSKRGPKPKVDRTGTRNKATSLPAVIVGHKGTQGVDFGQIAPSDIAIAVVQSQVNGMMPTGLLPDVVLYVDHTRELIAKLRDV
jgi:hypothetical protein